MKNNNLTLLAIVIIALLGYALVNTSNQPFPQAQQVSQCGGSVFGLCDPDYYCTNMNPIPQGTSRYGCLSKEQAPPPGFGGGFSNQNTSSNQNTASTNTSCDIQSLRNNQYLIDHLNNMCRQQAQTYGYTLSYSIVPTGPLGYMAMTSPTLEESNIGDIHEENSNIKTSCSGTYRVNGSRQTITLPDVTISRRSVFLEAICILNMPSIKDYSNQDIQVPRYPYSDDVDEEDRDNEPFRGPYLPDSIPQSVEFGPKAIPAADAYTLSNLLQSIQQGISAINAAFDFIMSQDSSGSDSSSSGSQGNNQSSGEDYKGVPRISSDSVMKIVAGGFVNACFPNIMDKQGDPETCTPHRCRRRGDDGMQGEEYKVAICINIEAGGEFLYSCPSGTLSPSAGGTPYCDKDDNVVVIVN